MKRFRPRFGMISLLTMPAMFALGWWARDRNYDRDVYLAAEQIAGDMGGTYIPELGIITGGGGLAKKMQAMSPQAKAEMQRRLTYYEKVMEPTFHPPRPSFWDSLKSLFRVSDEEEPQDESEVDPWFSRKDASDSNQVDNRIQDRIDAFPRMQRRGRFQKPPDNRPPEE